MKEVPLLKMVLMTLLQKTTLVLLLPRMVLVPQKAEFENLTSNL